MSSIGEELVFQLAKRGVDTVFGIPGVHTMKVIKYLLLVGLTIIGFGIGLLIKWDRKKLLQKQ